MSQDTARQPLVEVIPSGNQVPHDAPKPRTAEDTLRDTEGEETATAFLRTLEELIYAKSITDACERAGMSERTFHRVKLRSASAWQLYTRARMSRADYRFDTLIERVDSIADPHKARVMLEAEKWTIGKMNRQLYDEQPSQGVQVTINNDAGAADLEEIRQRLARKRKQLARQIEAAPGKSMLSGPGGGVERGGSGEGEGDTPSSTPESRT